MSPERRHTTQDGAVRRQFLLAAARTRSRVVASPASPIFNKQMLLEAARVGDIAEVIRVLDARPDLVDQTDERGRTPLHWAVWEGHADVARALVDAGADVNAKADLGLTPLWNAARGGGGDLVELLLAHGAEPSTRTTGDGLGWTPLHIAAGEGRTAAVRALVRAGADVNATGSEDGFTPLQLAVGRGHREVVELLVASGADVNRYAKGRLGRVRMAETLPPLEIAEREQHGEIATFLEGHGAQRRGGAFRRLFGA